jgi:hypothetical protein
VIACTSIGHGMGYRPIYPPMVTQHPFSLTVELGQPASFGVGVLGEAPMTYQWRKDGIAIPGASGTATLIPGATAVPYSAQYSLASASIRIANVQYNDAGSYTVEIRNRYGSELSGAASLRVLSPVPFAITAQPASATVERGGSATFTVAATGNLLTYQWRKDGVALPGATASSYLIVSATAADAASYSVLVRGVDNTVESDLVTLTVTVPAFVTITTQPASAAIKQGDSTTFAVSALGTDLHYQWKKNEGVLPGATNTGHRIVNATAADMGFYSVEVSNTAARVESNVVILTVTSVPHTFIVLAGSPGQPGSADGTGRAAQFNIPWGIGTDRSGNLYVAENGNATIRKVAPNGVVTTLAGAAGEHGLVDGKGGDARFGFPTGLAVDASGSVYVGDNGNGVIRRISPDGTVATLGGNSPTRFKGVGGVGIDSSGNVYVADYANHAIHMISANGVISTLAGSPGSSGSVDGVGGAARFASPQGLAVNGKGEVFVTDVLNGKIRKVSPSGVVTTLAGSAWGAALAVDGDGNLLVAEGRAIRRITEGGPSAVLGDFSDAYGGNETPPPSGISTDGIGNVFVAGNHAILKSALASSFMPGRLTNLSTRAEVTAGADLTLGFSLRGTGVKRLIARGVGPTLTRLGVSGTLNDPRLELFAAGATTSLMTNDDWETTGNVTALMLATAQVGAFDLTPGSKDCAILAALNTNIQEGYTIRISASGSTSSGVALAEVYDAEPLTASVRLAAVSALGFVGTGDSAFVPGFVIGGTEPKRLLIRAVGPGLAPWGVTSVLLDPRLALVPLGRKFIVASNDNWGGLDTIAESAAAIGAFALAPESKDAAIVVWLPPGGYTVLVSGSTGTTGNVLVEVYDLNP